MRGRKIVLVVALAFFVVGFYAGYSDPAIAGQPVMSPIGVGMITGLVFAFLGVLFFLYILKR